MTPGAVPIANRLITNASGVELAINAADGRLFYKDVSGNVQLIADKSLLGAQGSANIVGGSINGATIGATTPSTGNFTTVTTGTLSVPALVGMVRSNGNSGFSVATPGVDYVSGVMVGAPNGVASLDNAGKVPLSQLPSGSGGLNYLGTWNAATNTPTLSSGVGTKGFFYKVSVAGSTNLDGTSTWVVGDQVIFSGTIWERVAESSAPVQSVNGMTGAVVITRTGLSAAASGSNSDITSLNGMTTPLSVSQGGTGRTTLSGLVKANGSSAFSAAVAGTDFAAPTNGNADQLLANNGVGGFSNVTIGGGLVFAGGILSATGGGSGSGSVTSVNVTGGSTGLTFGGGPITTTGTIIMAGTLSVGNGGTGRTTLSGLLKGAGTAAIVSAVAGTDYAVPTNGTTTQLLANNGAGGFANVTVGSGLTYTGGVLAATGSGGGGVGTVTSVNVSGGSTGLTFSGGPVTSSGTITMAGTLAVANGGTGAATINGLVRGNGTAAMSAAVPNVDYALPPNGTNTQLLANNGSGGFANIVVGSGLSLTGGVLTSSGGGGAGTVTSVQVSGGATGLTFSGGPVTTSGTITMTGMLAVANGGTGTTTLSGLLKGNGTSAVGTAVAGVDYAVPTTGTNSQLLANNGAGGFANIAVGSGLSLSGGTLTSTVTATIPDLSLTDIKIATNAMIQATKLGYTAAGAGSLARLMSDRLGDFLSVKDFGAKGDGATNDSVAIATCISAAQAANKSVFFPDGSYLISSLGVQSGRVFIWGLGNATLKGTFFYSQTTFPPSAGTAAYQTPTDPYFDAAGLNFQSTTLDYGLKLQTSAQSYYSSTFSVESCNFFGQSGLWAQHMTGFKVTNCEFNNVARGLYLEGCADALISSCFWKNHAGVGTTIIYASNHGAGGATDRQGGSNIRFSLCSWAACVYGVWAEATTNLVLSDCTVRSCDVPLRLKGSSGVKLVCSTFIAANSASTLFSAVTGYVLPESSGSALLGSPSGYIGGEFFIGVSATECEFRNAVSGSTSPLVYITGNFNATYPNSATGIRFTECDFIQDVGHANQTLVQIINASSIRMLSNTFVSPNLSTTLTSAWRLDNCTNYTGFENDFSRCTQSNVRVGSSYERTLTTTFVQASDPSAAARPGDIWAQP